MVTYLSARTIDESMKISLGKWYPCIFERSDLLQRFDLTNSKRGTFEIGSVVHFLETSRHAAGGFLPPRQQAGPPRTAFQRLWKETSLEEVLDFDTFPTP